MSNLVIDLGRGLIIAGVLFVFLWVIMGLALLVSIREAWRERNDEWRRANAFDAEKRKMAGAIQRAKPSIPRPGRVRSTD